MAHHVSNENLSPAEIEFHEAMKNADDFFKIELLRPAKKWFQKALTYNIDKEKVEQRIEECNRLIKYEQKIIVMVVIAALIVSIALTVF